MQRAEPTDTASWSYIYATKSRDGELKESHSDLLVSMENLALDLVFILTLDYCVVIVVPDSARQG